MSESARNFRMRKCYSNARGWRPDRSHDGGPAQRRRRPRRMSSISPSVGALGATSRGRLAHLCSRYNPINPSQAPGFDWPVKPNLMPARRSHYDEKSYKWLPQVKICRNRGPRESSRPNSKARLVRAFSCPRADRQMVRHWDCRQARSRAAISVAAAFWLASMPDDSRPPRRYAWKKAMSGAMARRARRERSSDASPSNSACRKPASNGPGAAQI